jgi:hypothetical protein
LAPLGRTVIKTGLYRITDTKRKYDQEADWLSKWNNGTKCPVDADYRGEIE